jgi:hypothetical protein
LPLNAVKHSPRESHHGKNLSIFLESGSPFIVSNIYDETACVQGLTCLLPRRGVALPHRDYGAGPGSSIQGHVLALSPVSLGSNNSAAFYQSPPACRRQAKVRFFNSLLVIHFSLDKATTSLVDWWM